MEVRWLIREVASSFEQMWDELDEKLGFPKYQQGPPKTGWLVNMIQVSFHSLFVQHELPLTTSPRRRGEQTLQPDESNSGGQAGVDYYFIQDDGGMFKSTICYEPYFYIACRVSPALAFI